MLGIMHFAIVLERRHKARDTVQSAAIYSNNYDLLCRLCHFTNYAAFQSGETQQILYFLQDNATFRLTCYYQQ